MATAHFNPTKGDLIYLYNLHTLHAVYKHVADKH